MPIIQNNRVLSAPTMDVGGKTYTQAFSYDIGQGVVDGIMAGLEVRTNTSLDNPSGPEVTALGRGIGSGTPGEGVITIPNRMKYRYLRGWLRLRTGGSNDGWANSVSVDGGTGASIDDSYFMDGLAITGKQSDGTGHTWLHGILNTTYNGAANGQGYRPDFVDPGYVQQWVTTHGGTYTNNWAYWFNLNDPQGRPPVQEFYFERDLGPGQYLDGDILLRIQSNQGWANEDTGIEACTIWIAPEQDAHLQASDGYVRNYHSHGVVSHRLGGQNGFVEEKRWIATASNFSNPVQNIASVSGGANNHHCHFIVEVLQTVYTTSSNGANMHRGMAAYVSGAATPYTTTSMGVVQHAQMGNLNNVGTLSWSGTTLQYTGNRNSNYDDYMIKVTAFSTGGIGINWHDNFSRNSNPV